MSFHFTALLTLSLFCSMAIPLVRVCFTQLPSLKKPLTYALTICLAIVSLRLLIPLEFKFAKSIPIPLIFPKIMGFLRKTEILHVGNFVVAPMHMLAFIWALGSIVVLINSILSYRKFKAYILKNAVDDSTLVDFTEKRIVEITGKKTKLKIFVCAKAKSPMLIGYFKPALVLPVMTLSSSELGIIIKHELNHYTKGDQWLKLLYICLRAIYWWNPLCFTLGYLIADLMEARNTYTLFARMSEVEKMEYLQCIVRIAKDQPHQKNTILVSAFSNAKRNVITRRVLVESVKKRKSRPGSSAILAISISLLIIITSLSFFVVFEPYSINPRDEVNTFTLKAEDSYLLRTENGEFKLFLNDEFVGNVEGATDSFPNLSIYKNSLEVGLK